MNTAASTQSTPEATTNETQNQHRQVHVRPAVDIFEHEDHFLMKLDLPGVGKDQLEATVEKNVLTLTGTAELAPPEGYEVVHGEAWDRVYERSFRLNDEIDQEHISVELSDGVAQVKLPKLPKAQKLKLTIQ